MFSVSDVHLEQNATGFQPSRPFNEARDTADRARARSHASSGSDSDD